MPRVLIVEDEISLARSMGDALTEAGHQVRLVHVGEKVVAEFHAFQPQIAIFDVRLGGVNGLALLEEFKRESPDFEAIVVTAYGSVEVAVDAMKRGAADFLTKPVDLDVLTVAVDKVWSASQSRRRLEQFRSAQEEQLRQGQIIGQSPAIVAVRDQIARLAARLRQGTTAETPPILLTGETGTGKDLLASHIHASLPHRTGPFVALNSSAVPAELFESELFGHIRGAFSGATADKPGLLETADGGTLFLDEVGDLPLGLQPKLLRALETHTLRRIGDTRDRGFNVCLVSATNRNLARMAADGRFREDLLYRLRVVAIELPPLRERGDDVLLLAEHFCRLLSTKYGLGELRLDPAVLRTFRDYPWPGNVRELRHVLESAALTVGGNTIELSDVERMVRTAPPASPVERARDSLANAQPIVLEQVEKELLVEALERTGGNVSAAARLLSITREAMRYRMAKFRLGGEPENGGE